MRDIRLDNQLLIMECSNIRDNLEDILKNINDIEKKFIELTNNNVGLQQNEDIKQIKQNIIKTKEEALLSNLDKNKHKKSVVIPKNIKLPKINKETEKTIQLNPQDLISKHMQNVQEIQHQSEEVSKMQKELQQLIADGNIPNKPVNTSLVHSTDSNVGFVGNSDSSSKKMKNIGGSKNINIKSPNYYDSKIGDIK